MAFNNNITKLLQLLDEGNERPVSQSDIYQKRKSAVEKINSYCTKVQINDSNLQSKTRTTLRLLGVVMLICCLISMIYLIIGNSIDSTLVSVAHIGGVIALLISVVYTLNRVTYNPIPEMKIQLDTLFDRLRQSAAVTTKQPTTTAVSEYWTLHNRKNDKILTGLSGRIATKMGVPVALIRTVFILATLFTGGATIFLYFILSAIIKSANPK